MLYKIAVSSRKKRWLTKFLIRLGLQRMMRSVLNNFSGMIDGLAVCGAAVHPVFLLQAAELVKAQSSETEVMPSTGPEVHLSHENY